MIRTYSELIKLPTFEERFKYCQTGQYVGEETFGADRYLNQAFYHSYEWKKIIRPKIIIRDNGCDLAMPGFAIPGYIYVHHLNSMAVKDLIERKEWVMLPEYLVCCSLDTHNALHYGYESPKPAYVERTPNDTAPWLREVVHG